ncbi:hypothetical protein Tco_1250244 [Tanacetum coccineum]
MIVESLKEEKMYVKFPNNMEAEHRGSYLDVEGIKWVMSRSWHCQKEQTISVSKIMTRKESDHKKHAWKKGEGYCLYVTTTEGFIRRIAMTNVGSQWTDSVTPFPRYAQGQEGRFKSKWEYHFWGSKVALAVDTDFGSYPVKVDKTSFLSKNRKVVAPRVLMPQVVKSRDEIFSRWGYYDNHDLSRLVKPLVLTYVPVAIYGVCILGYMSISSFNANIGVRAVAMNDRRIAIALEFTPEFVYVCCMDFVECYLILLGL